MINNGFDTYQRWLSCNVNQGINQEKNFVQESFKETVRLSPAYQSDAQVNESLQPIVATKKGTNKCNTITMPGDRIYVGDLVKVFNEYWLCVESRTDEFNMCYSELWMCNHIFSYQDFDLNIIHKRAILDDGSYSKGSDKAITATENKYKCYISFDNQSRALHVDKRLGISVLCDSTGRDILEVGKIKWIDIKSHNYGEGSHLMLFGINADLYNPNTDSASKLICDYVEPILAVEPPDIPDSSNSNPKENASEPIPVAYRLSIVGRKTIRIGTCRTYSVVADEINGKQVKITPDQFSWSISGGNDEILLIPNGNICKVDVKEKNDLVGLIFEIKCICALINDVTAKLDVEVT